jgi:hypothetical protein
MIGARFAGIYSYNLFATSVVGIAEPPVLPGGPASTDEIDSVSLQYI